MAVYQTGSRAALVPVLSIRAALPMSAGCCGAVLEEDGGRQCSLPNAMAEHHPRVRFKLTHQNRGAEAGRNFSAAGADRRVVSTGGSKWKHWRCGELTPRPRGFALLALATYWRSAAVGAKSG